eukprot:NODE_2459_length_1196_cov_34.387969_g2244_i0.p1 GENE.NODE_2459_length_1196_cov_34.387969_g2244_i0~~NODE_2459_length_1196_cov_34.387969_g2244_i0.p1  ORF type:complete len:392 (+),score=63.90 NODE_2459_length_1196_cov_34.387969_g2244_i0:102-1178(+)
MCDVPGRLVTLPCGDASESGNGSLSSVNSVSSLSSACLPAMTGQQHEQRVTSFLATYLAPLGIRVLGNIDLLRSPKMRKFLDSPDKKEFDILLVADKCCTSEAGQVEDVGHLHSPPRTADDGVCGLPAARSLENQDTLPSRGDGGNTDFDFSLEEKRNDGSNGHYSDASEVLGRSHPELSGSSPLVNRKKQKSARARRQPAQPPQDVIMVIEIKINVGNQLYDDSRRLASTLKKLSGTTVDIAGTVLRFPEQPMVMHINHGPFSVGAYRRTLAHAVLQRCIFGGHWDRLIFFRNTCYRLLIEESEYREMQQRCFPYVLSVPLDAFDEAVAQRLALLYQEEEHASSTTGTLFRHWIRDN